MQAGTKKFVVLMAAGLFFLMLLPAVSHHALNPEGPPSPGVVSGISRAGDLNWVTVVQTLMRADGSRSTQTLRVPQKLVEEVMTPADNGLLSDRQREVLLGAGVVEEHTLQEWTVRAEGAEKGLPAEKHGSAPGNITWVIRGPSLVLATGYGISLTRPVTLVKALLNQWFGRTFQIMPPFFTVIPEIDVMLNYDGALGTVGLTGPQALSPVYLAVFVGFVGLHWRLLTPPLQVFMGAAGGVIALGELPDEEPLVGNT
ncbi:MAG TPA: hypothetical protein ENN54_06000 [Thermoplasmatales archaeon]|nr:hypothetical protein [Thermoplasmatales archaeon]